MRELKTSLIKKGKKAVVVFFPDYEGIEVFSTCSLGILNVLFFPDYEGIEAIHYVLEKT